MSLVGLLAGIAWGIFFTKIAFIHLASSLTDFGKEVGHIHFIKPLYMIGILFVMGLFSYSAPNLRPALRDFRRVVDATPTETGGRALPQLPLLTRTGLAVKFLTICVGMLVLGIGILTIGNYIFNTKDDVNFYHVLMVGILFGLLAVELVRRQG